MPMLLVDKKRKKTWELPLALWMPEYEIVHIPHIPE
jgi:hypothetical protein